MPIATRAHKTRFAPSPTGWLHLGHAASALFAAERGFRFLLRLEDIDVSRCRPAYAAAICEDLEWLGLKWEVPVRVQSEHLSDYAGVLAELSRRGLTYPCFCSRADIAAAGSAPHTPDGGRRYPGFCRALNPDMRTDMLAEGRPHAIRLDMAGAIAVAGPLSVIDDGVRRACDPAAFGDVVIGRRDSPTSYHLCVTHDDARDSVTLVTRGEDLRAATDVHRLLQTLMGWPEPQYAHHPLLTDAAGVRLSKRDGAASLRSLRAAGYSPAEVRQRAQVWQHAMLPVA